VAKHSIVVVAQEAMLEQNALIPYGEHKEAWLQMPGSEFTHLLLV
jgi:hypothetical protein